MADVYELVNPSDSYTLTGEREAVCAAAILLGEGMYPVTNEAGEQVLPFLAFGGEDGLNLWWRETFGHDFGLVFEGPRRDELAAALASVTIGSFAERARLERVLAVISSPEEREKARAAWHDERRGSMNDIGARAAQLAEQIRRKEVRRG